ncbi:hypothetical protein PF327_11225 [Sulfurovum sp. XTW-4]|uniref:GyrI-like small molecule binding domain-containing protein n=1 Tax=Sulfurovum xiamenensis TaxID=3019066 RepID=A0ABT7QUK0_9BACT|nr:hypothetical protein [Sulfurovum xiamenensis]MDM5264766.1 hypothetical protein [Sulfurovum xiamenensis]
MTPLEAFNKIEKIMSKINIPFMDMGEDDTKYDMPLCKVKYYQVEEDHHFQIFCFGTTKKECDDLRFTAADTISDHGFHVSTNYPYSNPYQLQKNIWESRINVKFN